MTPVVVLVIVALLVGFLCGLSAISVYMDILTDMPKDSTQLVALKAALKQAAQTAKPSMRGAGSAGNIGRP